MKYAFLVMLLVLTAGSANADSIEYFGKIELSHSGGTDKCGCHYNRKTGEYHCHTRKQRGGSCPA
nr:YHYH domain-containing protein [Vibrio sp. Sgm 5]